jgi:hypothetical protein
VSFAATLLGNRYFNGICGETAEGGTDVQAASR